MPLKNAILPGVSAITLSTSIVSPDGLKIDQSVPWIIEIGNGKSTASHKHKKEDMDIYNLQESNISVVLNYLITCKSSFILVM